MASHFSILAWKIPWTEETGRLQSMGSQRIWHNWACTHTHTHTHTPMHTECLQPVCKPLLMFHLTNMYQLSTLYVPGTEDSLVNKTSSLLPVQSKTTHSLASDSQSRASGATASALPKNLLEGQICSPNPSLPNESHYKERCRAVCSDSNMVNKD